MRSLEQPLVDDQNVACGGDTTFDKSEFVRILSNVGLVLRRVAACQDEQKAEQQGWKKSPKAEGRKPNQM